MNYGICPLSLVPVRNSPSDKSEMISQILFGELIEFLERKGKKWVKIRCQLDNFVGWVATNQLKPITPSEFKLYQDKFAYNLELLQPVMGEDRFIPITLGAHLANFDGIKFAMGEANFTFSGQAVFPENIEPSADFLLKIARKYLNAPYLWGGRSPMGIDSPGLVQVVFKLAGFKLPRETFQQVHLGTPVDFVEQGLPGDLAFFENQAGKITHAGILLPEKQIIHAFGRVRIDKIDHFGIYDQKTAKYTHKLRVIKRILPNSYFNSTTENTSQESVSQQVELF